jgi:hypothetical protein
MQVASLKRKYPDASATWKCGIVGWTGQINPAPICDTYTVRITWSPGSSRPVVRVLSPHLETRTGERLPHVFGDDSLCLHYHEEWTPKLKIAESIIPWASEWLYFYEIWLATGVWHGGGHEPARSDPKVEVK